MLRFATSGFAIDAAITRADFEAWIAADLARIAATVDQALARRRTAGGRRSTTCSSPAARRSCRRCGGCSRQRFGAERLTGGGEFVSVAEGLALIGRRRGIARWVLGHQDKQVSKARAPPWTRKGREAP